MAMVKVGSSWRFKEDGLGPVKTGPLGNANIQMSFQFDEHQKREENGMEEREKQLELDFGALRCDEKIERMAEDPEEDIENKGELATAE